MFLHADLPDYRLLKMNSETDYAASRGLKIVQFGRYILFKIK